MPGHVARPPSAPLRPFVKTLWASSPGDALAHQRAGGRELVLPSGTMHVVFRLAGPPLRLFDNPTDTVGRELGHSVLGGARASYYVKALAPDSESVGAELYPGACELLLGVPAGELAGRHTPLADVLGRVAADTRERLLEAPTPGARLALFERFLTEQLTRTRALHPAVAEALSWLGPHDDVREAVRRSGYSHRRFGELFRSAVGLAPKLYCRVWRFHSVLARAGKGHPGWSALALAAGYSDQSHLHRDFRDFAGMPPGLYGKLAPTGSRHVPAPQGPEGGRASIPCKTRR